MRNGDVSTLARVRAVHKGTGAIYREDTLAAGLLAWGDIMSLDAPLPDIDEATLHDRMRCEPEQHKQAERAEILERVRRLLLTIDRRYAVIIVRRYWMEQTLEQVGAAMGGLSRERVRQLEILAHAALKQAVGLPPEEPPLSRTHCIRGHDMRPREARFLDARGTWLCRECRLAWERANYAAKRARKTEYQRASRSRAGGEAQLCARGHDISREGAYMVDARGRRCCLECRAERRRAKAELRQTEQLNALMGRQP